MNIFFKSIAIAKVFINYKLKRTSLSSMPIRIWIESSLSCNLKCIMCPNKDLPGAEKGVMDFELYKKIIDEAALFVSDIYLHHRGEPCINKNLPQMISYAKAKGIKVRFHTNAMLINKDLAKKIVQAKPDLISVSFDGLVKDVYEEIRPGAIFETTVENIFGLLAAKKEEKSSLPYTVVEKINHKEYQGRVDQTEANNLIKSFKDAGLDEFITKEEYTWATKDAPDIFDKKSYSQCTFPWYATVICFDGTVTPCPQDYMAELNMGNVKDKTIREIWNDKPYMDLRNNLLNNIEKLKLCCKCDRLCRKQIGGIPFQYLITFLTDHFLGYGKIRKLIGSAER